MFIEMHAVYSAAAFKTIIAITDILGASISWSLQTDCVESVVNTHYQHSNALLLTQSTLYGNKCIDTLLLIVINEISVSKEINKK